MSQTNDPDLDNIIMLVQNYNRDVAIPVGTVSSTMRGFLRFCFAKKRIPITTTELDALILALGQPI